MEVGRSCISIDGRYLLDCGLKISEEGSEYPVMLDPTAIEAVFISHAHLDHTGALPLFDQNGLRASVYCNAMTRDTAKLLLKDSLHIEMLENQTPAYSKENIFNIMGAMQIVRQGQDVLVGNARATFLYAGHIPGSSSVLLDYSGMKVLYTGDINYSDTQLMKGARLPCRGADVMITEATYGDRSHPDRKKSEQVFLDAVSSTLDRGGRVLIPAFAVGRSQEVMLLLAKRRFHAPIYLDGMSKKVTNMYLRRPDCVRDIGLLKKATKDVRFIKSMRERKDAARNVGIFVTTSGMLDGGPVLDFMAAMHSDPRSAILLTGYQAEETNGRLLLEQGRVYIDGVRFKVACKVQKFDFSAHSGQKELVKMINEIGPKNLIIQHGDPGSVEALASKVRCPTFKPRTGDSIEIRGD